MATSTNFGWTEPDDTDLVKNGAAAMRTLGNAIDSTLWTVGGYTAGKNKIINGDFGINQRNFTSITTSDTYGFDRWSCAITDGTVTYTPQTFTLGAAPVSGYEGTNYARIQTTGQTLATARANFNQKIESVRTLAGQTATISFWAKAASGTPKIAIEMQQNFGSGGSPSSTVYTYGGQVTISTSWARYSVTIAIPSISGKTMGAANDSLNMVLWVSAGTDFNSRTGSLGIQTNTFDFWGVQVEAGSIATPFQTATGTKQGELAACQRYYWRTTSGGGYVRLPSGSAESTTLARFQIINPVTMRTAAASIDYSSLGGTGIILTDYITNTTPSSITVDTTFGSSPVISALTATVASGLTAFRPYSLGFGGSTSGYIGFSAEL